MGVPGFFRWISSHFRRCLEPVIKSPAQPNRLSIDNFYIDFNALLHNSTRIEGLNRSLTFEENTRVLAEMIEYLFSLVKPKKLVYIAIDGVAPRAKMNQQRNRRFMAVKEKEDELYKASNTEVPLDDPNRVFVWDANEITPGTPYMDKMSSFLHEFFANKVANDEQWKDVSVMISDSNVPGEGEHKLIEFIRSNRLLATNTPITHCIYGADADMILLALSLHEPNIYVIRENNFFMCKFCKKKNNHSASCKFIANRLVHFDLKNSDTKEEISITDEIEIATKSVESLSFGLEDAPVAEDLFSSEPPKDIPLHLDTQYIYICIPILREYLKRFFSHKNTSEADFERLIDDFIFVLTFVGNDFLPHLPLVNIQQNSIEKILEMYGELFPSLGGYIVDCGKVNVERAVLLIKQLALYEVKLFTIPDEKGERVVAPDEYAKFKESFYSTRFHVSVDDEKTITKICSDYFIGIQWVANYYYQTATDWDYYYPHNFAPFCEDLARFSSSLTSFIPIQNTPHGTLTQLMCVLPPRSAFRVLPKEIVKTMIDESSPLFPYYPLYFETWLEPGHFKHTRFALLPFLDTNLLYPITEKIEKEYEEAFTKAVSEINSTEDKELRANLCNKFVADVFSPTMIGRRNANHMGLTFISKKGNLFGLSEQSIEANDEKRFQLLANQCYNGTFTLLSPNRFYGLPVDSALKQNGIDVLLYEAKITRFESFIPKHLANETQILTEADHQRAFRPRKRGGYRKNNNQKFNRPIDITQLAPDKKENAAQKLTTKLQRTNIGEEMDFAAFALLDSDEEEKGPDIDAKPDSPDQ